jgi:hypothetical protein
VCFSDSSEVNKPKKRIDKEFHKVAMLLEASSDAKYDGDLVRKLPSMEMALYSPPKVFKRKSVPHNKPDNTDNPSKMSIDPRSRSTAEDCRASIMSARPDMADDWSKIFLQIHLNDL